MSWKEKLVNIGLKTISVHPTKEQMLWLEEHKRKYKTTIPKIVRAILQDAMEKDPENTK